MSASSAAADLAGQLGNGESTTTTNGWGNISRHRHQQSLTNLNTAQMGTAETITSHQAGNSEAKTFGTRPYRHSVDLNQQFKESSSGSTTPTAMTPSSTQVPATPPKLQTSFSANDIHTVKNIGVTSAPAPISANAHAQQHFHNHNASIGRIPPGVAKRHSRELSSDSHVNVTQPGNFPSIQSQLQASAPTFGPVPTSQGVLPGVSQAASQTSTSTSTVTSPGSHGGYPPYYNAHNYNPTSPNGNGYNGMPLLSMGMQNMNLNGYTPQNYTGYGAVFQNAAPRDSQQRVIQQRRAQDSEGQCFPNHSYNYVLLN